MSAIRRFGCWLDEDVMVGRYLAIFAIISMINWGLQTLAILLRTVF